MSSLLRCLGDGTGELVAEAFSAARLPSPYLIGTCLPDRGQRLLAGRAIEVTGWDHSL